MKTRRNFPKDSAFATEILEPRSTCLRICHHRPLRVRLRTEVPKSEQKKVGFLKQAQITRKAKLFASEENGWTVKCSEDLGMGDANEESLPTNLQLIG
jgi:hypothetical protein